MSCAFDKERLTAYYDGELEEAERSAVEGHISACSECLRDLGEIKSAAALVRDLPRHRAPRSIAEGVSREIVAAGRAARLLRFRKGLLWATAAAAALLIVVNVVYFAGMVRHGAAQVAARPPVAGIARSDVPDLGEAPMDKAEKLYVERRSTELDLKRPQEDPEGKDPVTVRDLGGKGPSKKKRDRELSSAESIKPTSREDWTVVGADPVKNRRLAEDLLRKSGVALPETERESRTSPLREPPPLEVEMTGQQFAIFSEELAKVADVSLVKGWPKDAVVREECKEGPAPPPRQAPATMPPRFENPDGAKVQNRRIVLYFAELPRK